jgi:hypothetical protein
MSRVTLVRLAVIAGFVVVIEALCRFGAINPLTLLPPSEMAAHLLGLLASGEINEAMAGTFSNVAIAFALSVVVGFAVGVVIHALPRLRRVCDPLLASYYSGSGSPDSLRASISRFSLIHSPSLRRSRLPAGFFGSGMCAARSRSTATCRVRRIGRSSKQRRTATPRGSPTSWSSIAIRSG